MILKKDLANRRFHGNRRETAEAVHISTVTLWRQMKPYGLTIPDEACPPRTIGSDTSRASER